LRDIFFARGKDAADADSTSASAAAASGPADASSSSSSSSSSPLDASGSFSLTAPSSVFAADVRARHREARSARAARGAPGAGDGAKSVRESASPRAPSPAPDAIDTHRGEARTIAAPARLPALFATARRLLSVEGVRGRGSRRVSVVGCGRTRGNAREGRSGPS
jgi:hypothetical protein